MIPKPLSNAFVLLLQCKSCTILYQLLYVSTITYDTKLQGYCSGLVAKFRNKFLTIHLTLGNVSESYSI